MKTFVAVLAAVVSVGVIAGGALAFSCPALVKAANEAIAKAEPAAAMVTDDREKLRAQGLIAEAKELVKEAEAAHKEAGEKKEPALHARSEAKAKAAKYLAEQVK